MQFKECELSNARKYTHSAYRGNIYTVHCTQGRNIHIVHTGGIFTLYTVHKAEIFA